MVLREQNERVLDCQSQLDVLSKLGLDELINPLLKQQNQMSSKFSQTVSMLNLSSAKGHKRIYAVCIARRFFNLLYGWEQLKEQELGCKIQYASNVVIVSENGILSYADEIAAYYQTYNDFPRIIIYDDMTITGDKLGLCITTLADAICWNLRRISSDVPNQRVIVDRLMKDITMLVLGKSIIQENVPLEAQRCIVAYQCYDTDERHRISRALTNMTNHMEVANTAYAISAIKNGDPLPDNLKSHIRWKESFVSFDGSSMSQYELQLSDEYQTNTWSFSAAIREYVRNGRVFYSPLILHQECKTEDFKWLSKNLSVLLMKKDLTEMAMLLGDLAESLTDQKQSFMGGYTFQLVEMILGQILLNVFINDFQLNEQTLDYDTVKVIRNFGKYLTKEELDEFVAVDWSVEDLQSVCMNLNQIMYPLDNAMTQVVADDNEALDLRVANIIYYYAIRTKLKQLDYKQRSNNIAKNYIQMNEYCQNMVNDTNEQTTIFESMLMRHFYTVAKGNAQAQRDMIAMTSLMTDLGFMGFCPRMVDNKIGLAYRHSEMTMLLYPILLGDKWPEVKNTFWDFGSLGSSSLDYKDIAWFLSMKNGMEKYGKLLSNMAEALEDNRLFWSVLKWDKQVN